jgi:hypothetical protein
MVAAFGDWVRRHRTCACVRVCVCDVRHRGARLKLSEAALLQLRACVSMRSLDLCDVGDVVTARLLGDLIAAMPMLEELRLAHCDGLTNQLVQQLKRAFERPDGDARGCVRVCVHERSVHADAGVLQTTRSSILHRTGRLCESVESGGRIPDTSRAAALCRALARMKCELLNLESFHWCATTCAGLLSAATWHTSSQRAHKAHITST